MIIAHLFYINFLAGGVNGASCLERAICEVAATPEHDDGVLGKFQKVKTTICVLFNICMFCQEML